MAPSGSARACATMQSSAVAGAESQPPWPPGGGHDSSPALASPGVGAGVGGVGTGVGVCVGCRVPGLVGQGVGAAVGVGVGAGVGVGVGVGVVAVGPALRQVCNYAQVPRA